MPVFPIPEDYGTIEQYREKYSVDDLKNEFGAERYDKLSGDYEHILCG